MRFTIYPSKNEQYKDSIIKKYPGLNFVNNEDIRRGDLVFVFGGDGTFLKFIKSFDNKGVKVVFVNEGKVGFLSSFEKDEISSMDINDNNFNHLYYLKLNVNNYEKIAINELIVEFEQIKNVQVTIDEKKFQECYFSKIYFINYIGTTGLARSFRYPIIDRDIPSFIVDIVDAPQYSYNRNINQPIVLNKTKKVRLNVDNLVKTRIICDNEKLEIKTSGIQLSLEKSKSKFMNVNNFERFLKKMDKLF